MDKVVATAAEAVADVPDGASLAVGGFGLSGVPNVLIEALYARGVGGLSIVSNNCGAMESGLAVLLATGRIARVTGSHIGANKEFARQYLAGELEVELIPQGTLAERLRAGGAGIPAFYTPAGVGTQVAEGGLPWRYDGSGHVALASPAKEVRVFDGTEYVLERGIRTDFALVRAAKGDRHGNLVFNKSTRNFNPLAAMAGRITIAEVEEPQDPRTVHPAPHRQGLRRLDHHRPRRPRHHRPRTHARGDRARRERRRGHRPHGRRTHRSGEAAVNPVHIVDAVRTPIVRPGDPQPPRRGDRTGHPLGAAGARLAGTLAHQLARRGSGTGVATLCIGVGQGLALVLER